MASSSASYHTRSKSLPSKSNLFSSQFDEQISRIRSSESASSSSTSSKLAHLSGLYDCIDEFLQLPSSQKALHSQRHEKSVENALEGSIKLLDVCSSIRDVCLQMKERTQELQSILRRRCSEYEISKEVAKYLKDLKKMENNNTTTSNETIDVISRLRECQMASLDVLEFVLVAMVGDKASSRWESVISKMMKSKSNSKLFVGCEAMDATSHPEKVKSQFQNMEMCIKDVEQGVEPLFRNLIKTRTNILNILNI